MFLIADERIMIPLVSLCVFIFFYMWSGKAYDYLKVKGLGNLSEIIRLLDLMFVEFDQKKVTTLLLLLSFGLGTVVFLLLLPNVIPGLIFGAIVVVAGWHLPLMLVQSMYQRRCGLFVAQMVDGLTIMANGIKSGLTVTQAMERVVDNLGNPISQEFALVLSQIRIGRSVEEALVDLGVRIDKPDVQMFVTAINILKETGGNLAETFQTICLTIRERQKIERKIEAMTAQGVMQGIIITLVPIFLLVLFYFVNPPYIAPLFNTTLGLFILLLMFVMLIIGGITIRKVVSIKV